MVWYDPIEPIKYVTVSDMYEYVRLLPSKPLLTGGDTVLPTFMTEYSTKWPFLDVAFKDKYGNSYYFNQKAYKEITSTEVDEVYNNFVHSLLSFFWLNEKKYDELYRVHLVDDTKYSVLDNYDVTETKSGSGHKYITDAFGNRVIQEQENIGEQENEMVGEVAPYDSENFSNQNKSTQTLGDRQDTSMTTHNAHTDNHSVDDNNTYTLNKKGNIGVQTQSEVMQKHVNFWKDFSFYNILFEDINKEFLLFYHSYL